MSLGKSIRRTFWRGLAALLPALLTIIVLSFGLSILYNYGGAQVNEIIIVVTAWVRGIDPEEVRTWYNNHWLHWVGVVVSVVGLCALAYLVGTFLGARLVRFLERSLMRIPLAKNIYPGAKQVSEFFFSERKVDFSRVVAIEFPRKGIWMAGFVTGKGFQALRAKSWQELLSVFVPFSPAPITGYTVMVSKDEVVDLPLTVDEAFQYMLSAGVIMPQAERPNSLREMLEPPAKA
ncbi:MAG: DUF502 domain-containing protein [Planctomycetota bacterium]|nr:DUF502 domain-containing protein [Planctomycetota bacterium]